MQNDFLCILNAVRNGPLLFGSLSSFEWSLVLQLHGKFDNKHQHGRFTLPATQLFRYIRRNMIQTVLKFYKLWNTVRKSIFEFHRHGTGHWSDTTRPTRAVLLDCVFLNRVQFSHNWWFTPSTQKTANCSSCLCQHRRAFFTCSFLAANSLISSSNLCGLILLLLFLFFFFFFFLLRRISATLTPLYESVLYSLHYRKYYKSHVSDDAVCFLSLSLSLSLYLYLSIYLYLSFVLFIFLFCFFSFFLIRLIDDGPRQRQPRSLAYSPRLARRQMSQSPHQQLDASPQIGSCFSLRLKVISTRWGNICIVAERRRS
jgi:hypothetical protein